ncbi:cysteine-rich venom protein Mr30-like [Babylonia areolata]|uniref:cysteine-rich venom protein Mr30-like n=1 Tax=Babylonia areolata TaxID=304850 RepID=UPI003FCEFD59
MARGWCVSTLVVIMTAVVMCGSVDAGIDPNCEPKYLQFSPSHTRCLTDSPKAKLVPMTEKRKKYILKLHNRIRASELPTASNMMKLRWDDNLAKTAERLVMQCEFNHDEMRNRMEPDWPVVKIGQNLGMGHRTFGSMMSRFYSEKTRLNYTYGGGYIRGAGHYFQLVSYEATRVGCATAKCRKTKYKIMRACNYAPALNADKPPYKSGPPCGDCLDNCDASGKLCDCGGKLCYNGGEIDPSTCQCVCQEGKTGENCQDVDCSIPDPFPSCRDGRLTKADCGRHKTVIADPLMCPHLCGYCPACSWVQCQNGGVVNNATCQCECPSRYTGLQCQKDCSTTNCSGHGTPYGENGECFCTCDKGFHGKACQNVCEDQPFCQAHMTPQYCQDYCARNDNLQFNCPVCCGHVTGCTL